MAPSNQPAYVKDERVLCFHHELLYEAKVLESKSSDSNDKKSPLQYRVHYKGWKNTWDDWVPQDRLRKLSEENKELAQNLRKEMDALMKRTAPKAVTASSKKKAAGSDLSSTRGSEERHSSVPATGRGQKRGRDFEIEKVGHRSSPSQKSPISAGDSITSGNHVADDDTPDLTGQSPFPIASVSAHFSSPQDTWLSLSHAEDPKEQARCLTSLATRSSDSLSSLPTLSPSLPPEHNSASPTSIKEEESIAINSPDLRYSSVYTPKKRTANTSVSFAQDRAHRYGLRGATGICSTEEPAFGSDLKRSQYPPGVTEDMLRSREEQRYTYPALKSASSAARDIHPQLAALSVQDPGNNTKRQSLKAQDPKFDCTKKSKPKAKQTITGNPLETGVDERNSNPNNTFTQEEAFHSRPAVRLPIPDHLKAILVDDWENVTKNQSLVPLPSSHPVNEILTTYFDEEKGKRRLGSAEADLLEEVVAGVKEYFDKCLGRILLYRFEREQFFDIRQKWEGGEGDWEGKGPGDVYGAEHLCRLFVTMPELIAQTNMDSQSVNRLREELAKLTQWLGKNSARFFTSDYAPSSHDYIEKAKA